MYVLRGTEPDWQSCGATYFCLRTEQVTAQAAGICFCRFGFLVFLISQLEGMSSGEIATPYSFSSDQQTSAYHALFISQKYVYQHITNITPLHPNSDKAQGQLWEG